MSASIVTLLNLDIFFWSLCWSGLRCKMIVRVQQNRAKSEKWVGTICPNIFKNIKQNITRSINYEVVWSGK